MPTMEWILIYLIALATLLYTRTRLWVASSVMLGLAVINTVSGSPTILIVLVWLLLLVVLAPLNILPLRRWLYARPVLAVFRRAMPTMSDTERQALEAGTVGWTRDLFSGMPDWNKLLSMPGPALSDEEQAFLDGPVETLCQMLSDWEISRRMTIPDAVWDYIKAQGLFSMIIPKQYGGHGFSAIMHSHVIAKLSSVCSSVATTVSVPNSLGPAELLLRYGTDEQKQHYLPRLAKGEEIPCFALTSPVAGSDAGAIEDHGVVCEALFEGKQQLCIRLNWDKRYITLSPVATLIGMAFKLYDPDQLLGDQSFIGITCALIPADTPGVVTGRRHYPLDSAFPNGPTQGHDVLIPVDWIIGGVKMAGHGWRMLMECLAAGRSISLPSIVDGGSRRAVLCSGAYARIRRQFNTYIGKFQGIQEPLARMLADVYMLDALRVFTVSRVDQQEEPVVESAIGKYHATTLAREITHDAMDVQGGKGICMGPSNYLAQGHFEIPISITVEGANILTRNLIIFGQGAIRCHPYILKEMQAAHSADKQAGLQAFDQAFFGHIGFLMSNHVRAMVLSITGGRFARVPHSPLKRYYQQFTRFSAVLAFIADVSMVTLGGKLKRLEFLSARLGDVLSYLYTGSAVLKLHALADERTQSVERPVIEWICQDLLHKIETALHDFIYNFPNRFVAGVMRLHALPWGRKAKPPADRLTSTVAALIQSPSLVRDRLNENLYQADKDNNPIALLNRVLETVIAVEPLLKQVGEAKREGLIRGMTFTALVDDAVNARVVTADEAQQLLAAHEARLSVIRVDDFAASEIERHAPDVKEQ